MAHREIEMASNGTRMNLPCECGTPLVRGKLADHYECAGQETPAQRVGIDGVKVKAVVGRYNAIRLTATMVNALAGVGRIAL